MVAHDGFVGDDRDLRPGPQRRDLLAQQSQQAAANENVVAALAERDVDDDRIAGTQRRRHGSWPPSARAPGECAGDSHPAGKRAHDLVNDLFVHHLARLHGEIGQSIHRIALLDEFAQRGAGVVGLEQRPVVAALDALHEHIEFGLEPDRDAFRADRGPGVRIRESSATGRQHLGPALQQAQDDARLARAEFRLPANGENIADRHARRLFDLYVRIDERNAKAQRQAPADRGLARPHHAHEHNRARAERRHDRGFRPARDVMGRAMRHVPESSHGRSVRRPNGVLGGLSSSTTTCRQAETAERSRQAAC